MKRALTNHINGHLSGIMMVLLLGSAQVSLAKSVSLYKYDGKLVELGDLDPASQQAVYDAKKMYFENVSRVIEANILDTYIEKMAKEQKKEREKLEEELFAVKITEAQGKAWFDDNKARLGGRSFESVKADILQFLDRQEKDKIRQSVIKKVKKTGKFEMLVEEPTAPTIEIASKGFPFKGGKNAKVTLIEFADYKCPHCADASKALKVVADKFKDKIKFVFMDFPLRFGGVSTVIAEGGVCANAQGKYWDYHYQAFDQQSSLEVGSPEKIAKDIGLKMDEFKKCQGASSTKSLVKQSRDEGARIGVQGTPAIFLNGKKILNYESDYLIEMISKMI